MKRILILLFLVLGAGICFGQSAEQADSLLQKILTDFRLSPDYQLLNESGSYDSTKWNYEQNISSEKESLQTLIVYRKPGYDLILITYEFAGNKISYACVDITKLEINAGYLYIYTRSGKDCEIRASKSTVTETGAHVNQVEIDATVQSFFRLLQKIQF